MQQYLGIKKIWQEDDKHLGIVWGDDRRTLFDVVELRRKCPCASCVDELTGERIVGDISESTRPVEINSVGRYAMSIKFSDGHSTGIYSFDYLLALAEKPMTSSSCQGCSCGN